MEHIAKSFGGVHALRGASFRVMPGEIHALLGENGAGKSTLVKILAGVHPRDAGAIRWEGQELGELTLGDARHRGVRVIYQQLSTIAHLSVAQNLMLGRERHRYGVLDVGAERRAATAALARLGVRLDLRRPAGTLRVAERQLIEIARALAGGDVRLLLMDEPTASLGDREVDRLFAVIRGLRDEGISVVYISHKLEEVFQIADRITVLRDGQTVGTVETSATAHDALIEMMVGRPIRHDVARTSHRSDQVVLEAVRISTAAGLENISFALYRGEVLGVYGLLGSGRTELARALFGADSLTHGELLVAGRRVVLRGPGDGKRAGIGLVPEERAQAAFPLLPIRHNITVASSELVARRGWLRRGLERAIAARMVSALRVKTPSSEELLGRLSGGNQQKVIVGRWLVRESPVLILDDPTAGVDVGAKDEIYKLIASMTERGTSVVMSSSELPELLAVADRILVLHEGTVAGILEGTDISERAVVELAVSGRRGGGNGLVPESLAKDAVATT
jgi:ribose transport system ATP-binding protein